MKLTKKNTTWNLDPFFDSDDDPNISKERKALKEKNYAFIDKWKNRTDYLEKPEILQIALEELEKLNRDYDTTGNEWYYFWLKTQQNQNDPKLKARYNQIVDLVKEISNDRQFFLHDIAKISPKLQERFLKYPGLQKYHHFLERLFNQAKYLLSDEEEKIINLKDRPAYSNWVKMISEFLAKEERDVLTESGRKRKKSFPEIMGLISHHKKEVRDSAAQELNEILEKYSDVAEAEINSILQNKKIDDELRKISRPDLTRHLDDDIDSEIVDTLIAAVSDHFDIAQKYYQLKAKLLGVKKLQYHERNIEYGRTNKKFTFEKAVALVEKVFTDLDPEFAEIFNRLLSQRQVDVFPKKGKKDGAFCAVNLISQPTYVLLNQTDKLNDVLTLAHEFGHAINDELMKKKQNALNFETFLSTAEVASTFMEDFVIQEVAKQAKGEQKLSIMMMKLNDDISSIFRQIACYKFEQELHQEFRKRGYLSKKDIGQLFQKHMQSYMGKYVEQSPGSENWWVYWGHIRRFFYNYSYANGQLISKSLQASVKKDPQFIVSVKDFLSAGSSDSPKNIFARQGIDISKKEFWLGGIKEIEELLKETEKLAKELKKIN